MYEYMQNDIMFMKYHLFYKFLSYPVSNVLFWSIGHWFEPGLSYSYR